MMEQMNVTGAPPVPEKPKGLAIAGMVCGIVGCIPCLSIIAIASAIVGIVLSVLALKKVKAGTGGGKNLALAGLICGIAGLALFVIIILVWGAIFLTFMKAAKESAGKQSSMLILDWLRCC